MKFGLDQNTHDKINAVLAKYPEIERVLIYGSRAKGTFKPGSDIDMTLLGEEISEQTLSKLKAELYDLSTPYLFDVSVYKHIESIDLKEHIERAGKTFYEKEAQLSD